MGPEFSEYFTWELAKELAKCELPTRDRCQVETDPIWLHKRVSFAECLVCGGRGFFGLSCKKCNEGVYNIGIGFCSGCNDSGILGVWCQICRRSKYQSVPIRCLNVGKSRIFRSAKPELDKVWYNDTQRSFLEPVRDSNLFSRQLSEIEMRRNVAHRRGEKPLSFIPESSVVLNLNEAFD